MIKFGIRQSFENIEQIEERFSNLPVPIELALPYHWKIYEPVRTHLMGIAEKIESFHVDILSIHAVQAPITNDEFRIWGKEIADFAKILGAKIITVHPNNTNKNQTNQEKALKNMAYFKRAYQDKVVFCVETFTGNRRIFDPDAIVESGLPMTLDVAHIYDNEKIWHLLKTAKENIKHVHLSAKRDGSVVLEYLPEFHNRLITDLKLLEQRYK